MAKFFFSRFKLEADKGELDKAQFVFQGISSDTEIVFRKDNYKFIRPEVIKVDTKLFITGHLAKYKPLATQQVVNQENEFESVELKNKVLAAVRFFIDTSSSIIIFEEDKTYIPKESFGERFKALFEQHFNDEYTSIDLQAITEGYEFFERVQEVALIKKISITLVPSNPNNSYLWRDVDDRLNNENISVYRETQINNKKDEGLNIDEETKKKFYMSEDGYGNSSVSGKDANGDPITITTADAQSHSKINLPTDVSATEQIKLMKEKLSEIIKRTDEQN